MWHHVTSCDISKILIIRTELQLWPGCSSPQGQHPALYRLVMGFHVQGHVRHVHRIKAWKETYLRWVLNKMIHEEPVHWIGGMVQARFDDLSFRISFLDRAILCNTWILRCEMFDYDDLEVVWNLWHLHLLGTSCNFYQFLLRLVGLDVCKCQPSNLTNYMKPENTGQHLRRRMSSRHWLSMYISDISSWDEELQCSHQEACKLEELRQYFQHVWTTSLLMRLSDVFA